MPRRLHGLVPLLVAAFMFGACDQADSPKVTGAVGPGTEDNRTGSDPIVPVHRTLDPNDVLFGQDVTDVGEFHNDVLRAVDRRHKFSSDIPLSEKAYRGFMVEAVNEVLVARGIVGRVTLDDVTFLARQGHHVAAASGFGFAQIPDDAHLRLIEFLQRTGRITPAERDALLMLVHDMASGTSDGTSPIQLDDAPENPIVTRYRHVAVASRALWGELRLHEDASTNRNELLPRSEILEWGFEQFIDAAYAAVAGGGVVGALIGAYFSGIVWLVLSQLNEPSPMDLPGSDWGGGGGDGCPCCLCTGP